MSIQSRIEKLEQKLQPKTRDRCLVRAGELQSYVENSGELIEQMRQQVCPEYAELVNEMNLT
jgi:hypothetical protein